MKVILLVVIVVIVALVLFFKKNGHENDDAVVEKLPHPIERNQSGRRLIRVTDMDNAQLEKAIRDFTELYERNDAHIDQPDSITNRDGAFYLSFSPNLDYDSFCFWVNYLVYSKKGERYDVTGWYEMGEVENDETLSIGRQTLMFFIPVTDTEYDNVYVVNRFNHCYKQEFSGSAMLKKLNTMLKNYETIPD